VLAQRDFEPGTVHPDADLLGMVRELTLLAMVGIVDPPRAEARAAIADGVATGGMIPKLETAIAAVESGVDAVVILDGRRPHAMLVELFTEHGAGTLITAD
jgi:acetylglutamate kinase